MDKKKKSKTKDANQDGDSFEDLDKENKSFEFKEESSGAEVYEETAEDAAVDYEKIKQDLLKEYAQSKELEAQELPQENKLEVDEDLEEDNEKNEQLEVQEFLQENNSETNHELEEKEYIEKKELESQQFLEENTFADKKNLEISGYDNNKKVSLDNDLEIEDIQESLDGDVINKPRSLNQEEQVSVPDVDQGLSKVAISKGSSVAILIGLVLLFIYIIYKILQPSDEELAAQKSTINKNLPIVSPVEDSGQTIVVPEIPAFPDIPTELTPPTPKDLPAPPVPPTLELAPLSIPAPSASTSSMTIPTAPPAIGGVKPLESKLNLAAIDKEAEARAAAEAARKKARMKSSMMAGGSGGGGNKNKNAAGKVLSILERNSDQTVATHIGDLQRIIAQGKIIDAVLETAINTDLPGLIRGVVTRDVYSEAGNNVLINKGSRLIGSYSSEIKFGQARVQIVWDRVIRPDGIDIKVSSPGIDDIGRSGSAGDVDNHILRNFTTAMMVSLINIGVAEYADSNGSSNSTSTTTTNTDGSTTNTDDSSTVDQAYDDAIDNISSIGTDVIDKTKDMPPTITINQGTSLKVFVKQDLVFPGRSANLTRLVE